MAARQLANRIQTAAALTRSTPQLTTARQLANRIQTAAAFFSVSLNNNNINNDFSVSLINNINNNVNIKIDEDL